MCAVEAEHMSAQAIGTFSHSPLARLDFRAKLAILLATTALAFLWASPLLTLLLALAVLGLALLARMPASYLMRLLRWMAPLWAVVLLLQGFGNPVGNTVLWAPPANWPWVGELRLTLEGLLLGGVVILRTLVLVLIIPVTVLTTELNDVLIGLVRAGVPYWGAFILSATLRFVPLLFDEARTIIEAQRLRGLALEKMGILQRLNVYSRLAVPLVLGAMVRSQQLEVVLAARAFSGSADRTYLHETRLRAIDYVILVTCVIAVVLAAGMRITQGIDAFTRPGQ